MLFVKSKKIIENIEPQKIEEFAKSFNIHPIVVERIMSRGYESYEQFQEFLYPSENSYHNPFLLNGMIELVDRLHKAIENKERILVFGDYDVDGISATAIMLKTINMLGGKAFYYLPNRYVDGYGLTNNVLVKLKHRFNPSLIITVDCGISCYKEVEFAKTLGIEVIVTDHHEIPETLPSGIVVNAKIKEQKYPFRELCGTGLAYKISQALLGERASCLLPIAGLATIADIVPLVDENRAIVYHALKRMSDLPLGLKELIKSLKIDIKRMTSSDVSFKIAPRLNASGRMGDAQDSLTLYLSEDIKVIQHYIEKINEHNTNRQDLCTLAGNDCDEIISKMNMSKLPAIILSSRDWDHGILGIVSAKLSSKYNRPVFLFSEEVGGILKGSARSVYGVNIHELLASMQDILEAYGGHPIAAGITLKSENFNEFIKRVNEFLIKGYSRDLFFPSEEYDVELSLNDISMKLAKDLAKLEPCGCDNPQPKFLVQTRNFVVSPMKNYIEHCNIKLGHTISLVYFNYLEKYGLLKKAENINIIFEIQLDKYSNSPKGIIKAIDSNVGQIRAFNQNFVLPYLEQLQYLGLNKKATYTQIQDANSIFEITDLFGSAYVVNTEKSFLFLREKLDFSKIGLVDIYKGSMTSGINGVFICPQGTDFATSYKKIYFLDNIIDESYIAKINSISDAEIIVVSGTHNNNFFKSINSTRDNFINIYKDISRVEGRFVLERDIYEKIVKSKKVRYSYRDFYAALCVFKELKIVEIGKIGNYNEFKINTNIKSDLNNSKIYNYITSKGFSAS